MTYMNAGSLLLVTIFLQKNFNVSLAIELNYCMATGKMATLTSLLQNPIDIKGLNFQVVT